MGKDMATRKSGSRQNKPNKTIDLKANDSSADVSDMSPEDVENTSSGYDILKSVEDKKDIAEKPDVQDVVSEPDKNDPSDKDAKINDAKTNGEPKETLATPVSTPPVKSAGMGTLLLSAVLGGGVALGGASLISQISALESVPVIGGLFKGSTTQNADSERIAEFSAQLTALSSEIETLKTGVGSDSIAEEALGVAKAAETASQEAAAKINELSQQIISDSSDGVSIDVDGLKSAITGDQEKIIERIAALEAAEAPAISQNLETDITGIKEQIGKLGSLEEASTVMSTSLAGLDERMTLVETSINDSILPSMESVQAAAGAAIESQKVARSVSARALGAVLENGGSFAGELAAAEALLGQTDSVAALKALARKGVLNQSELAAEFADVSNAILSIGEATPADQGFMGKLFSSAKTLVKVRPAGPVDGDTNTAIVSRIAASLSAGNVSEALAQWETLGEEAKTVSMQWQLKAKERVEAETHINNVIGELGLSSPNQG